VPRNEQKGESMIVKIIEKNDGDWSQGEISAIRRACGVEVQTLETMPRRLALVPLPVRGPFDSLEEAIGHDGFVLKEVKYNERWA